VLFFIEVGSRRVHVAGCAPNPSAPGVTQQARQPGTMADRPASFRALIRDRDQQFTAGVDDVFRGSGLEIIRTPCCAPQANGVAERFVRPVRSECLDWLSPRPLPSTSIAACGIRTSPASLAASKGHRAEESGGHEWPGESHCLRD